MKLEEATERAAHETSRYMTRALRNSARAHGWPEDVVSNTHVAYNGSSFDVKVHGDYLRKAEDLEYGTEVQRPTAVMRKFSNTPGDAEAYFTARLRRHSGGSR